VRRLSTNPARIIHRAGGSLAVGAAADIVLIDPERRWVYDPAKGFSKSRNSPWAGREMIGCAIATLVGGVLVWDVERGVLLP
jgi:dihydroorotase